MILTRRYSRSPLELCNARGRTGKLSNQFHKILVATGLAEKRSHHSTGKGRKSAGLLSFEFGD
jgi:hypothetical protein